MLLYASKLFLQSKTNGLVIIMSKFPPHLLGQERYKRKCIWFLWFTGEVKANIGQEITNQLTAETKLKRSDDLWRHYSFMFSFCLFLPLPLSLSVYLSISVSHRIYPSIPFMAVKLISERNKLVFWSICSIFYSVFKELTLSFQQKVS